MASRGRPPGKRQMESECYSQRRSRRRRYSDDSPRAGRDLLTTPRRELAVNVEELSRCFRRVSFVETPKRRNEGKMKGKVLFEKEVHASRGTRGLPIWSNEEMVSFG